MRILGAFLFAVGAAATAHFTVLALSSRRPRDVAYAVLAPLALALAVLGLVLFFAPGFTG